MKLPKLKLTTSRRLTKLRPPEVSTVKRGNQSVKVPILCASYDAGKIFRAPTTKDIFLRLRGTQEEGALPDGLYRLLFCDYVAHMDPEGKVVALDVVPSMNYRGGAMPVSQEKVTHVTIEVRDNGAVMQVTQIPYRTRADALLQLLQTLRDLFEKGENVTASTRIPALGKITRVEGDTIEVLLKASSKTTKAPAAEDDDEIED